MSTKTRKIGYYYLMLRDKKNSLEYHHPEVIIETLESIVNSPIESRVADKVGKNKFHFLQSYDFKNGIGNLLFKSAKTNHSPPLLNRKTMKERKSPKLLIEGDAEKTHISFKLQNNEILFLLEERQSGISRTDLAIYLSKFCQTMFKENETKIPFNIIMSPVVKENFEHELKKLKSIGTGEIFADKKVLGSEFLDFSDRTSQVKENILIKITASPKSSIKSFVQDVWNKFNSVDKTITKIKIYGESELGERIILDTDLLKRIDYINVEVNDTTGETNTSAIFSEFKKLLISI